MHRTDIASPSPAWPRPRGENASINKVATLRNGFAVATTDSFYGEDVDVEYCYSEAFLKFHYKLAGSSAISDGPKAFECIESGQIYVLFQPTHCAKRERIRANTHERAITLICTRGFASEVMSASAENLPTPIKEFLRPQSERFVLASVPLPPQLRSVAEEILNPPVVSPLHEMMLEAKALELLCFTMDQMLKISGSDLLVRPRDRAKVRELCAMLEDPITGAQSIGELCKALAWNETQMMECFKKITGMTISSYRQRIMMDKARRRLRDTDTPITEIAFDAGYEYPSNFSTAFKRTFGYSPKMARLRPN